MSQYGAFYVGSTKSSCIIHLGGKKGIRGAGGLAQKHGLVSCLNYIRRINSLDYDSDVKIS